MIFVCVPARLLKNSAPGVFCVGCWVGWGFLLRVPVVVVCPLVRLLTSCLLSYHILPSPSASLRHPRTLAGLKGFYLVRVLN
jgi:hypothetical protein